MDTKLNPITIGIAYARRIKRLAKIRRKVNAIILSKKLDTKGSNIGKNERILIASSTFGNEHISTIDLKIKNMLDEWKISNNLIFCEGGLSACSMREEEKKDLKVIASTKEINYACISCNMQKQVQNNCNENNLFKNTITIKYSEEDKKENLLIEATKEYYQKRAYKGVEIHEHAKSSLVRYIGKPLTIKSIYMSNKLKKLYIEYLKSACEVVDKWNIIIDRIKPTKIILNHGLYIPQGIILEIAQLRDIPVTTWHLGYRKNTLLIAHGDTYHKTLVEPLELEYLDKELSERDKRILDDYIMSRKTGENDQISFVYKGGVSKEKRLNSLKMKTRGKINFLIPTNVSWDAQSHFKMNIYESMEDWIDELLKLAPEYLDTANFVFRCHPAEITGRRKSRYSTAEYLKSRAKNLKNIYIIKPDELISTYDLIDYCDAGIIYASKVGIEIAYSGKELIVCGEACIKCKGIGRDITDKDNLRSNIDSIIRGEKKMNHQRAIKYAYHIFFEEMIEWKRLNSRAEYENDQIVLKKLLQI